MMIIMSKLPIYASELDVVESITAHKRTEGAIKKEEISKVFIGLDEMQTYIEVYEYQYDRNGRVIVETFIDDDPTGSKVTAIEYDENGRKKAVKKAYLYTSDVFFDIIYTYEENGNSSAIDLYTYDGILQDTLTKYLYKSCDNKGNVVKIEEKLRNSSTVREISYDNTGNIIKVLAKELEAGELDTWNETTIEYDKNGNAVKIITIGNDAVRGNWSEEKTITYDLYGNMVKEARVGKTEKSSTFLFGCENGVCVIATDQPSTVTFEKCYQNKYDEHGRLTQVITTGTNIEEGTYICTKYTY